MGGLGLEPKFSGSSSEALWHPQSVTWGAWFKEAVPPAASPLRGLQAASQGEWLRSAAQGERSMPLCKGLSEQAAASAGPQQGTGGRDAVLGGD